jgi:SAM-dependent methyltransferase
MSQRFIEIAESEVQIQNPLSAAQLIELGRLCDVTRHTRLLDLGCGKGELLCQWAKEFDLIGVGVDSSSPFIDAARMRGFELEVWMKVTWAHEDEADYPTSFHQFDVVSCLGGTWIGGGLRGTLDLMRVGLSEIGGTLVVGEPFWLEPPTMDVLDALEVQPHELTSLYGLEQQFKTSGLELIDYLTADSDQWDAYEEARWRSVAHWLDGHPDDDEANALRAWSDKRRRAYLDYGRRFVGWGAFVLR